MNKNTKLEQIQQAAAEAAEEAAFHSELTEFVATLPKPSAATQILYAQQLQLLESIHAEIFNKNAEPAQPGDDYEPSNRLDFAYIEPYELSKF